MSNAVFSKAKEICTVDFNKPHVVILGAGASKATCPSGDKNGRSLPVMADLVETLGLADVLERSGIEHSERNFEDIYSELYGDEKYVELTQTLEDLVAQYFRKMELPDYPTIYDYLVLSLRSKDVIATFNWDPLLLQAYVRNSSLANMPTILYLHGCCVIGYCATHKIQDELGQLCPFCDKVLTPTRLLFPVANKDYVSDPYVASQWETLKLNMEHAFILTIFGYGAPETDVAAVELMQEAWGTPEDRWIEKIEIIDKVDREVLTKRWRPFIHTHHYLTTETFFNSLISQHPRRSCDALLRSVRYGMFREGNPVPEFSRFEDLWAWFRPLLLAEEKDGAHRDRDGHR
jgi:hypothetical protein